MALQTKICIQCSILSIYPDVEIKKSALAVAKRHLWYLSEINVGLAFSDERLTQAEKENMFKSLENQPAKKKDMQKLEGKTLVFDGKDLSHFVTAKTKMFFGLFGIQDKTEYYSDSLREKVKALKEVNDTAERGIALIKQQQKQFLLRVVEHHRKAVTKRTKERISSFKVE